MKEHLISFETAKLVKEKGFNLDINGLYWEDGSYDSCENALIYKEFPNVVSAPTQSLLQKWLREKRIDITVITDWKNAKRIYYVSFSFVNDKNQVDIWFSKDNDKNKIEYSDYENALEIALQEALKLIK